jgi:hypothetical protein
MAVSDPKAAATILNALPSVPPTSPPIDPVVFSPYPDYSSDEYLKERHPVEKCYLDNEDKVSSPDIFAYPGVPQNMTDPFFGSHELVGLTHDRCFDRFGRLGPYGYGYDKEQGGLGLAEGSEKEGSDKIWSQFSRVDYRNVDWGKVQRRCYEKNRIRFDKNYVSPDGKKADPNKTRTSRTAYVLRTWIGYEYPDYQILNLRAMINELHVKSGGEYDIHLLVHVKDNSIPIWASEDVYRETLEKNVPKEFWGLATLWSEKQMEMFYPGPFTDNVDNDSKTSIHGAYRGLHLPLQWFAYKHPEYDYFWHWEMDMRFTGHYYELHEQTSAWAKKQPRKGLWERAAKYYIPRKHGSYEKFTEIVEEDRIKTGEDPIWGFVDFPNTGMLPHPESGKPPHPYPKDNYEWGVGEEADLIVFNPLFRPEQTNWVFRDDVTGYNLSCPVPPRRVAIITVSRLSRKLLDLMHKETWKMKHHMFPEMWAPSVALHHGLKAVYVPHPVYFDRDWPLDTLDNTFNHPGAPHESPFGWGEHNQQGSSFYYNSGFSPALWRRWLGSRENNEGGSKEEAKGTGRMCLLPLMFHPIKHERGDN